MLRAINPQYHSAMNNPLILFPTTLLPHAPDLLLEDVQQIDQTLLLVLRSTAPTAACPLCQQPATRIHSHYARHPADLPWGGHAIRFELHVRKFFCLLSTCPRRIFTERLPDVVAPSARATVRLTALLHAIALALGGEAGARLAQQIGIAASPTLLISLIRRAPVPLPPSPRILGVDDWAQRKGIRYGTALVDLERHRLIDLLPDREAGTLARWLAPHDGIAVIARDRRGAYATGAREGAPDAVQVADRWHLLSNWHEAIERVFNRYRSLIKQVSIPHPLPAKQPAAKVLPPKSVNRRRKYADERRARVQAERLALYTLIRARHAKGEYLTTIARDLKVNYKTARKYALADECPMMKAYPPRQRLLTPYEPYLRARWSEGCRNGKQLHREIVAHGFRGSRPLVSTFVAQLRRAEGDRRPITTPPTAGDPLTPHTAAMLMLRRPERCGEGGRAAIAQLRACHADIATTIAFTERFVALVRERRGEDLSRWLADAQASGIREIGQFAVKIRQDEAAVRAGCTLAWSNGQTEGQVTRLKLLKRQMYGRAKFDLLRQRALAA
jgi:transposase